MLLTMMYEVLSRVPPFSVRENNSATGEAKLGLEVVVIMPSRPIGERLHI